MKAAAARGVEVGDVMTGDIVSVQPSEPAGRVLDLLLQSGLHALPVIDDNDAAVGLVTVADLVAVDRDVPVGRRLSMPPLTVDHLAPVTEAAKLMRREYVHHLLVTEDETVIGVLSSHDLVKVLEALEGDG